MTPLLLLAADTPSIPDGNLGKILALLVLVAMILQPIVSRRFAKGQTAVISVKTDEQTEMIMGSINDVRHEVRRMAKVQEVSEGLTKIALEDHTERLREYRKRLDGHDQLHRETKGTLDGHDVKIVDLHERVSKIETRGR